MSKQGQGPRQARQQAAATARDSRPAPVKFVRLSGLWLQTKVDRETGEETKYMTGQLGAAKVFVFRQDKRRDSDPDYALFVAADQLPSQRQARRGESQ